MFATKNLKANCVIKEINKSDNNYNLKIFYPETKYLELNEIIKKEIDKQMNEFLKSVSKPFDAKGKYQLIINFDSYEYHNYISFVFNVFIDTLGAHPNTYCYTINYDTKNKKNVTIQELVDKNKNILNILSKVSYDTLKEENKINEYGDLDMLKEGTLPIAQNFEKFVFTNIGLKLFFNRYDVAPYVSGEFCVMVPYDTIKIDKSFN
ncbi:MAG: DUF3298 domain-containing protein [Clostridia bacterium]